MLLDYTHSYVYVVLLYNKHIGTYAYVQFNATLNSEIANDMVARKVLSRSCACTICWSVDWLIASVYVVFVRIGMRRGVVGNYSLIIFY